MNLTALHADEGNVQYSQCGGLYYTGSQACAAPYTCTYGNAYYWQVSSLPIILIYFFFSPTFNLLTTIAVPLNQ
jgi:hypothetical protein